MVFLPYAVLLLGASALSVNAQKPPGPPPQTTPASAAPSPPPKNTPGPAPPANQGTNLGPSPVPLTQYTFTYPNLPEQVNPFPVGRGPQSGYNICNKTTEGPNSLCQTMFVNDIEDFCLWGSDIPNGVIGNIEAQVVAWCTKPGHGTRIIPPGTFSAVQFIKTSGYIQLTGLFNQTGIGLQADDAGGELDPHGADLAGNPLGGLVFSNNTPTGTGTLKQVHNWSNFVGGNQFCIKACDDSITSPDYCQNIYDTQGCAFNMPAAYAPGIFLSCLGDNQAPPGASPAIIPATSSCTTYQSSDLWPNTASTSAAATTTAGGGAGAGGATGAGAATGTASKAAATGSSAVTVIGRPGLGFFALTIVAMFAGAVIVL